mmetsp:Transcript_5516/g.6408  ORF Transcript_5516/g.6408 Transcript_5516/m.6408 type:complete len:200 (-) Transcript_5516:186-785(-)
MTETAKRAPAKAIDRVADPAPALASTTSVPAFWIRLVSFSTCSSLSDDFSCESRGNIVTPLWPPTTGTFTSAGDTFKASATNVFDLTISKVETPNSRLGSNTPFFFNTSAAIGTVELTGLEMMQIMHFGQASAIPSIRPETIPALILNKSSRVMPGLRGTPAGITATSTPASALRSCAFCSAGSLRLPTNPSTFASVSM